MYRLTLSLDRRLESRGGVAPCRIWQDKKTKKVEWRQLHFLKVNEVVAIQSSDSSHLHLIVKFGGITG